MTEEIKRKPGRPPKARTDDETVKPIDNDRELLSAAEIEELETEVREEAEAELKEAAKKSLKSKLRAKARQEKGLEEAQIDVVIDLAPYCDRLLIDNVAYLQGLKYTVRASLAAVLYEQMQRTWGHQSEIDGKSENFYRRTRGARVVPSGDGAAVITTSQLLRA